MEKKQRPIIFTVDETDMGKFCLTPDKYSQRAIDIARQAGARMKDGLLLAPARPRVLEALSETGCIIKAKSGTADKYLRKAKVKRENIRWLLNHKNDREFRAVTPGVVYKTEPMHHQKMIVALGQRLPELFVFGETGVGKTKPAIDLVQWHLKRDPDLRAVVICPSYLIDTWAEDEFPLHSDLKPKVLIGTNINKAGQLLNNKKKRLFVFADSSLAHGNYGENYKGEVKKQFSLLPAMIKANFDLVVIDEVDLFSNTSTERFKAARALIQNARYVIVLTGTPESNRLEEIYGIYKLVDGGTTFGTSVDAFRRRFMINVSKGLYEIWAPKRGAFKEIKNLMYGKNAICYLKKECLDLKPKIREVRVVELTREQAIAYQIETGREYFTDDGFPTDGPRHSRLRGITSGWWVNEANKVVYFKKNPKMDLLKRIISRKRKKTKVIIWALFRRDIRMLYDALSKMGYNCCVLYGSMPGSVYKQQKRRFLKDKDYDILIGQPAACGRGLTLNVASLAIYYSQNGDQRVRKQTEDRCHRAFQRKSVTYITLVMRDTCDERSHRVLCKRRREQEDMLTYTQQERRPKGLL